MKIEHMALYVCDLDGAKDFFVRFFGARAGAAYHNPKTDFKSYFLTFESGCRLEIMTRPGLAGSAVQGPCAGYAHIAFSAGSREQVDALTAVLNRAGFRTISGPRLTGDGYYESCILGPEGCQIEITE